MKENLINALSQYISEREDAIKESNALVTQLIQQIHYLTTQVHELENRIDKINTTDNDKKTDEILELVRQLTRGAETTAPNPSPQKDKITLTNLHPSPQKEQKQTTTDNPKVEKQITTTDTEHEEQTTPEQTKNTPEPETTTPTPEKTQKPKIKKETRLQNTETGNTNFKGGAVTDLRLAISIGDKFLFQRELFNGDGELLHKTIGKLDKMNDMQEALNYLQKHFDWDTSGNAYQLFINALTRRFNL